MSLSMANQHNIVFDWRKPYLFFERSQIYGRNKFNFHRFPSRNDR